MRKNVAGKPKKCRREAKTLAGMLKTPAEIRNFYRGIKKNYREIKKKSREAKKSSWDVQNLSRTSATACFRVFSGAILTFTYRFFKIKFGLLHN